ncbi:MAG TPA: GNAT family N-acetyltransferase [Solirubrobacterales bacterium]|nr:GNAT family N-acetyltransferase [Solirubrobacterales bacterium]
MAGEQEGYEISSDPSRLDIEAIWGFLRTAYWSAGVERDVVERSVEGSTVFGLYAPDGSQAGFARLVTDGATFAWLADLFVFEEHRGHGLGVMLADAAVARASKLGLRQVLLATADAHGVYERFGFEPTEPGRYMVHRPVGSGTLDE